MIDRAKNEIKFEYKSLDGEVRKCTLTPLKRKEALRVFHTALGSVVIAITDSEKGKGIDIEKVVNALDFDKLWDLADSLLEHAVIDTFEIKSIDDTDFFEDKPEELYIILIKAIKENYPDFFTKLMNLTKGGLGGLKGLVT